MAIDTPAKLGIIGAGPAGLEACLYARFLGYDVVVFESESVGRRLQNGGPLGFFGDFSSTLGRAAIAAQRPDQPLPLLTQALTCQEWLEQYVLPLSECDLVADHLRPGVTVTRVSKEHLEEVQVSGFDRGGYDFVIETRDKSGATGKELVDGLIDASGRSEGDDGEPVFFNYECQLDLKRDSNERRPPACLKYGDELPDGTKLTEHAKKLALHEPNFYVIGEKMLDELEQSSANRYSGILDQIRAIFTILGDRTTLDLYATAVKLPQ